MKKTSIFMALAAVALGFASCSQDRDPVYQMPTEFVLNTPSMEDQYIELSDNGTLELVASQPDYGYSAVANYSAEMSLTEDFAEFYSITPTDAHQSRMIYNQMDVALGMCDLLGITSEDDFNERYPDGMPYMKVYFRAVCQLEGVESSRITSNTVAYNNLKGYLAVQTPGYIYLVGDPNGWNINAGPEWRLYEPDNAIGSKVYTGVFHVNAGSQYFRFYTEIGNWGDDGQLPSIGSHAVDGDSSEIEWVDGSYTTMGVPGKGSWYTPADWEGGDITMVVDLSDMNNITVTMYAGAVEPVITKYVYMVGNNGGWAEPVEGTYEDWKLADTTGTGIYTATFDFADFTEAEGVLYCRFYQELTGWGAAQWSSDAGGGNVDVTSGVAAPTFPGEGCFVIPAAGHKIEVVLDTNTDQVTFTYVD